MTARLVDSLKLSNYPKPDEKFQPVGTIEVSDADKYGEGDDWPPQTALYVSVHMTGKPDDILQQLANVMAMYKTKHWKKGVI
jgi:hypothetical protein